MELTEYFSIRDTILEDSLDDDDFVQQELILSSVLPYMNDAQLIESEDFNDCYYSNDHSALKINGYTVNESGERLQLFCVDENSVDYRNSMETLCVPQKKYYEDQFKLTTSFVRKSFKGELTGKLQESDPANGIVNMLSDVGSIKQIDVVEIFLVSLTLAVSTRSGKPKPKGVMHFANDNLNVSIGNDSSRKNILILRRVIDLEFIANAIQSRGHREALTVKFSEITDSEIELLPATIEPEFESHLCVLDASILAELYRKYSSRLLEKNVRSFLQFRGVNKGIRDTIRKEPEKFIAYNNGLTITATNILTYVKKKKTYMRELTDFQIVNGGQTTASIYFTNKDGYDISRVKVVAKINLVKGNEPKEMDDLISKISQFSNTQTKVTSVDLRSRNPQLVKLKSLSNSVVASNGRKWFFERAKGEFNTELRSAGGHSSKLKKEFPPSQRFSKEQLAKYYSAWGETPHLVKKGGEKIFRSFIEELSPGDEDSGNIGVLVDRVFYERLISLVILFRALEKIYGQGKNSMGQLRSAVIPYSLSIVYIYSDGAAERGKFDFNSIWKSQSISTDLEEYFRQMLLMVNDLIKKYSTSDDFGEHSKKEELWSRIRTCSEVSEFMGSASSRQIFERYITVNN